MALRKAIVIELLAAFFFAYVAFVIVSRISSISSDYIVGEEIYGAMAVLIICVLSATILVLDAVLGLILIKPLHAFIDRLSAKIKVYYSFAPYIVGLGPIKIRLSNPLLIVISLVFLLDIIGGILFIGMNLVIAIILILWGAFFTSYFLYRGLFVPSLYSVKVDKDIALKLSRKIPWYLLLARIGFLNKISNSIYNAVSAKLYDLCLRAGYDWSSIELSLFTRSILNASLAVSLALLIPSILVLNVYGLVILLLPIISLAILILFFTVKAFDRSSSIGEELPFLGLAGLLSAISGLGLSFAFKKLSSKDFPAIRNEYRNLNALSKRMDPVSALNELAKQHPNRSFREFIYGYTSILLSGGDIVRYLEDRVSEFFNMHRLVMDRYVGIVSDVLSACMFVFIFSPLIILLTAFVSPGQSLALVMQLNYLIIPSILMLMYVAIHGIQPRFRDIYNDLHGLAIAGVSGGIVAVLTTIIGLERYLAIGITLFSMTISYGLWFKTWYNRVIAEEKNLVRFIRDLIEFRKIGYSIDHSIRELLRRNLYDPLFNSILQDYLNGKYSARSWLIRATFRILSVAEESGSDLPSHLEIINKHINSFVFNRLKVKSTLRPKEFMLYLMPFIIAFCLNMIYILLSKYSTSVSVPGFILPGMTSSSFKLLTEARNTVIYSSIAMSLLVSKASDYTIRNTIRASIVVALSLVSIYLTEIIASIFF